MLLTRIQEKEVHFEVVPMMLITLAITQLTIITVCLAHDYHSEGWKSASGFLRASMDPGKDPCRDFYGYACGRWLSRESREGSDELRDAEVKLRDLLLTSLEKIELNSTKVYPNYQKWLRVFYDQCMDLSIMNETELFVAAYRGLEASFLYLDNVTHISHQVTDRYRAWISAGYCEQNFLGHLLIEANIDWIVENCTKKSVLKFGAPSSVDLKLSHAKLVEHTQVLYPLFGMTISEEMASQEADKIKALENDLNTLLDEQYDANNGQDADGKLIQYSQLAVEYPDIDWDAYLLGLFPEGWAEKWNQTNPKVLLVGDVYFKSIGRLIDRTDFQTLQNYAYWKLIAQIKEFYVSKTSEGVSGASKREKKAFCFGILKEFAPAAVARTYFDALKTDLIEWRNDVDLLAQNILSAFRIFVSGQDWMDAQDKMAIVERINGIRIDTGIPIWLANETEVNGRTPRFDPELSTVGNVVNSNRLAFMDKFRPLVTPGATFVESPPVFTVGARYIYGKIEVNLGQLLPPLYNHKYPLAVKYGMLGWLLGHELLHGFDQASLLEGPSKGQNWLRSDVEKMFHQRKRCMVKQYSTYCYKESGGQCLSGVRTVNENIGDIEGLKIAYMAYKFVTQTIGAEPPIPELVKLSSDQAFFISAAQLHCGKEYTFILAHEEHPPNKVRVEQSMRNFPVFAQAFKCRKGSKFSPIRTCSLWGRFVSPNQCDSDDNGGWEGLN